MKRILRKRVLLLGCICSLLLSGCGIRFPVLVPDNQSVSKFLNSFLSDQKGVSGSYTLTYTLQSGKKETETSVSGRFVGSVDGLSQVTANDDAYYYDSRQDLLYEQSADVSAVYSDGHRSLDKDWWSKQLQVGNFKYGGTSEYKANGKAKKVFVLDKTYSGDDLKGLLSHLHIRLPGSLETAKSDMTVSLFLNRYTGQLYEVSVQTADTGRPVQVLSSGKQPAQLSSFSMVFTASDYGKQSVTLPKKLRKLEVSEFPSRLDASSLGEHGSVQDGVLFSEDGSFAVSFDGHRVFDTVEAGENGTLAITSSQMLTGEPHAALSFVTGLNAYDSAKLDAQTALAYYGDHGFAEIQVDERPVQTSVDDYGGYYYGRQYTETEFNYVAQEYAAYIGLTDTLSLKCTLSGMTDRGVNGVINDAYFRSLLSCISIENLKEDELDGTQGDRK